MRYRGFELCLGVVTTCVLAGTALAGPALDEATPPPVATETSDTSATPTDAQLDPTLAVDKAEEDVWYGAALRVRNVRIPRAILELFLERSAGGASNVGVGFEVSRRRGNVELQLGFEFEHLQVGEGVWIDSGDNVASGSPADYVLSPEHNQGNEKLGWATIEFTFLNHAPINKYVAIRYGGGAGIGIITGSLQHYDVDGCQAGATNSNPEPGCVPRARNGSAPDGAVSGPVKYDLPPVFPVVNAILGVQFTPLGTKSLVVNLEGGIRTAPFIGFSIGGFLKP